MVGFLILMLLQELHLKAQEQSLTLWLVPNEPAVSSHVSPEQLKESFQAWLDRGIDLFSNFEGLPRILSLPTASPDKNVSSNF